MKHLAADALDLRHRLPLVWQQVKDPRLPAWVARKVAAMSRSLAKDTVVIVDVAVAAAADQSPGRVLAIAEAKVIQAHVEGLHPGAVGKDAATRSVCGSRTRDQATPSTRPTEKPQRAGSRSSCRPAPPLGFHATASEVADAIHHQLSEHERHGISRGEAADEGGGAAQQSSCRGRLPRRRQRPRPVSTRHRWRCPSRRSGRRPSNVSSSTWSSAVSRDGVARAEGIGPVLLEQGLRAPAEPGGQRAAGDRSQPHPCRQRLRAPGPGQTPHPAPDARRRVPALDQHRLPASRPRPRVALRAARSRWTARSDRRPQRRPADAHPPPGQAPTRGYQHPPDRALAPTAG